MKLDWNINLRNVITLVGFMVAMVAGFTSFQATLAAHSDSLRVQGEAIRTNQEAIERQNTEGTAYSRNALVPKLQRIEDDIKEIKTDLKSLTRR